MKEYWRELRRCEQIGQSSVVFYNGWWGEYRITIMTDDHVVNMYLDKEEEATRLFELLTITDIQ